MRRVRKSTRPALARAGVLVVLAMQLVMTGADAEAAPQDEEPVSYLPPVEGEVVDPFRPPAHAFGPGNRGLTYNPPSGTAVKASADGTVTFAGSVAGSLHVTVLHRDGIRTSYSFLESVAVRRGETVAQGDAVGTGGPGFHFGARDGDTYIDPALLFGEIEVRVRLIPHREPYDIGVAGERRALVPVVRERGLLDRVAGLGASTFGWASDTAGGFASSAGRNLAPMSHIVGQAMSTLSGAPLMSELMFAPWRRECTRDGVAVPTRRGRGRIAVTVGGYGSTSSSAAIEDVQTGRLGYAEGDVLRYSYAGGRVPDDSVAEDLASIEANGYDEASTFDDLREQGRELADLIQSVAAARPGTTIDIYAHSQGGLVSRLALLELASRSVGFDNLGVVVTIGTPHTGADLATGAKVMGPLDHAVFDAVTDLAGTEVDARARSVGQMAETSSVIRDLTTRGVPDGVAFRTIGARGDLVVTGDKTKVRGEPWAMVDLSGPSAHDSLPGHEETTRELELTLADAPPGCRSLLDTAADTVTPQVISSLENGLSLVIGATPG